MPTTTNESGSQARKRHNGNGADTGTAVASNGSRPTRQHSNKRSREEFAMLYRGAGMKGVESILEHGVILIEAKNELDHGEYQAFVTEDLRLSGSKARALKQIAKHSVLSNRQYIGALPPCWSTLAILVRLKPERLIALIEEGAVHAGMEQKEATALVDNKPPESSTSIPRHPTGRVPTTRTPETNDYAHLDDDNDDFNGDQDDLLEELSDEIPCLLDPWRVKIEKIRTSGNAGSCAALQQVLRDTAATFTRLADEFGGAADQVKKPKVKKPKVKKPLLLEHHASEVAP
jgi:hypothetical protein